MEDAEPADPLTPDAEPADPPTEMTTDVSAVEPTIEPTEVTAVEPAEPPTIMGCSQDSCADGSVCDANGACVPCGKAQEECCLSPEVSCNSDDLTCSYHFALHSRCVPCGNEGEECCDSVPCNGAALVCYLDPGIADANAVCAPCGGDSQPSCDEDEITPEGVYSCVLSL